MANLGYVGLGAMGGRMAERLISKGHTVTGYNRTKSKAQWIIDRGMRWGDSPRAVAEAVGVRLQKLSRGAQVLVVTHSPQVAARGHAHWKVRKSDAGGLTATTVDALDEVQRLEEIARMLSGTVITDEARAAARALVG